MHNDLREFISRAEAIGEYKLIEGADWNLEIGTIGELLAVAPHAPLLLFDKIKGYNPGYRVVTNLAVTHRRTALSLGLPELTGTALVKALRDKLRNLKPIPPVEVKTAPVKENVHVGDQIDLFEFPTPKWHEMDGGRYIGTGCLVITRDPDEGWVNFGTYRVQVQDKNTATIAITGPDRHGNHMARKYWDKGLPCPTAVSCGQEPVLFFASASALPWGLSEYDYAGGFNGKPVEITRGVTTDLPIPATAEIVLEGEIAPPGGETRQEGPFGEWSGYYAGPVRTLPAFKVKSVLHRNQPIIQGNPSSRLPSVFTVGRHFQKAASLWNELDRQLPGVRGVAMVEQASEHCMVVISLKQMYAGHAKQAASIAVGCNDTGRDCTFVIVVDEDIDPSNISDVLWALGTRTDPKRSIEILEGCRVSRIFPTLTEEQRKVGDLSHSLATIMACKPFEKYNEFPPSVVSSPELVKKVREKWGHILQ